jgi:hypothetical protein
MSRSNRAMQLLHLEQAEQHITEGERRIANQEERIARLGSHGHRVVEAKKILDAFRVSQVLFIRHRDLILQELGQ